jgi:sarcosine oxidase
VDRVILEKEAQALYRRHVAGRLHGLSRRLTKTATCLYAVTPDAGFIIDRLREDGTVLAASCCSGHGFKHSPALGEELAMAATEPGHAIEPKFALARFG